MVWRPPQEVFEKLGFVVSNGRTRDIRGVLLSSVRKDSQCLVPSPLRNRIRFGLRDAFAKWSIATGRFTDRDLRAQAWKELSRAWDEELIWPLVMAAELCQDPVAANQQILLAEVMRTVHPLAAKLSEKYRDRSQPGDGFFVPPREENHLDDLLRAVNLANRISRVYRNITFGSKESRSGNSIDSNQGATVPENTSLQTQRVSEEQDPRFKRVADYANAAIQKADPLAANLCVVNIRSKASCFAAREN